MRLSWKLVHHSDRGNSWKQTSPKCKGAELTPETRFFPWNLKVKHQKRNGKQYIDVKSDEIIKCIAYLQSFFGLNFGNNADIDIILDNQDERKMAEIKDENGRKERMFLFYDGESVTGKVFARKLFRITKCFG